MKQKNKCSNCKVEIERWDLGAVVYSIGIAALLIFLVIANFKDIHTDGVTTTGTVNIIDIILYIFGGAALLVIAYHEDFWTRYETIYVKKR